MKIHIEPYTTADVWRLNGPVKLRIYANQSFWNSDGQYVPQGTVGQTNTACLELDCEVIANNLNVPGFEIDSTVDSPDNPWATYTAELVAGSRRIPFLSTFAVNTKEGEEPTYTWIEIVLFRNLIQPQSVPESTGRQISAMVNAAAGMLNKASLTNQGITALTADPLVPGSPVAVSANDPKWLALSAAGFLSVFNVKDYGAVGDGVTDDTAAVLAALADLTAAGGGVLYFPLGSYITSGGFVISVPCQVRGDISGSSPSAAQFGSKVNCTSRVAHLFEVTADTALFSDLYLFNTNSPFGGVVPPTPPTASAGIKCTAASSSQKVDIERCVVEGFYNDVEQDGAHWSIYASHLINPVNYALFVTNTITPDAGDWMVTHSTFFSKTYLCPALIHVINAGGGKIASCKFNSYNDPLIAGVQGYTIGIEVTYTATIILLLSNLSIENYLGSAIVATQVVLLAASNIEVGDFSGATDSAIRLVGCTDSALANIVMLSFSATGQGLVAVKCTGCQRIHHSGLASNGFVGPIHFLPPYIGTYIPIVLQNGWANSGGVLAPAGYTLTNGRVSLRGTVTGGAATTIGFLPAHLRPGLDLIFPGVSNGNFQLIRIVAATGAIVQEGGGPSPHQSLDSVSYDLN